QAALLEGRFENAILVLNRARVFGSLSAKGTSDLAAAYYELGAAGGDRSSYQKSVELFSQAIEQSPQEPALLFNRALAYEAMGARALAIADWKACIALDQDHAWASESASRLASLEQKKP